MFPWYLIPVGANRASSNPCLLSKTFYKWLSGPEKFSRVLRNGPLILRIVKSTFIKSLCACREKQNIIITKGYVAEYQANIAGVVSCSYRQTMGVWSDWVSCNPPKVPAISLRIAYKFYRAKYFLPKLAQLFSCQRDPK